MSKITSSKVSSLIAKLSEILTRHPEHKISTDAGDYVIDCGKYLDESEHGHD